jgi:hypothetical protein
MSATVDWQARAGIQALEEWAAQRDRETAELSARLSRVVADFARLAAKVNGIGASRHLPSPAVPSSPPTPAASVSATKPPNAPSSAAAPDPRPALPPAPRAPPPGPSAVALPAAPAGFASLIVAGFRGCRLSGGKRFALLRRGSRDGFHARPLWH